MDFFFVNYGNAYMCYHICLSHSIPKLAILYMLYMVVAYLLLLIQWERSLARLPVLRMVVVGWKVQPQIGQVGQLASADLGVSYMYTDEKTVQR